MSWSAAAVSTDSRGSSPGQSDASIARDAGVIDLHDDLGGVADRMHDHRMMYPPSTTSAAPIVELEPGAAR